MFTGRQQMLDMIASGIAEDEIDYLISKVGINRVKDAMSRVLNVDDATATAREKMPPTLDINGVTYWRRSS